MIEDLQALAGCAALRRERLDSVLDHHGKRDVLREPMAARCDHPRILHGRDRRVAGQPPFPFVDLLDPHLVWARGMCPAAADRPGRLRPGHCAAETRDPRHALSLPRPADGVVHPRHRRGPVRLSAVRLECGHRASNQIEADIGSEDRREFDRLDDVAVEGVDVNLTGLDRGRLSFRLLLLSGPRRLRGLRRFRGLRSPYAAFRGRLGVRGSRGALLLLGIRQGRHTPCFDWREMYVRSGDFSSFTYPPRAASRNRMRRFVGPGIDPCSRTNGFRRFP